MMCAKCLRKLTKPGVPITIHGRTLMLGPVCAAKVQGTTPKQRRKERRALAIRQLRAVRVDQLSLFEGVV